MAERITGKTKLVSLLGTPISHSTSPMLQNSVFAHMGLDYVYVAFDVGTDQLKDAVQAIRVLKFRGSNVTMPNKIEICQYLDGLSQAAKMAGAVNTVVNDDGVLTGHITDGTGFMMSVKDAGVDVIGKKVTQIGMGGAGTAIAIQAALDGVKEISIFNRRDEFYQRAQEKVELIKNETGCDIQFFDLENSGQLKKEMGDSSLLINATPVGMEATMDQSLVPSQDYFHKNLAVADVVYIPNETKLLKDAKKAGCKVIYGTGMLLFQGVKAFEIWTGKQMPVDFARDVLAKARGAK